MRAYQITSHETPPSLVNLPVPEPQTGQLRVRIHACGLNFADLLMQKGTYQDTPPLPFVGGMEIAGVVDALGPDTDGPAPGTRVAVFAGQGGLAEYGCFDAHRVVPLPDDMPFEDAAAFMVAYGTSHVALDYRARLQPGENLLVLGAAGGVETIFSAQALMSGILPPTLNLENPEDTMADLDLIPLVSREKRVEYVLCNGFGFGGVNAAIILKRY